MKLYTLDNVVRSALADRGYPVHFYLQFLQYGIDALRMLNFDILQSVKSVRLPVNSYKAVILPCDFVDIVRLGTETGQYVVEWGPKDSLNRLNDFDANGNKIPYTDPESESGLLPNDYEGFWYSNYTNDKGEHKGRIFNNFPAFRNSYKLLRERNEIQLDTAFDGQEIVLDYISDGLTTDASNAIHPYAIDTIKAYIIYKMKEHSRAYGLGERRDAKDEFYNQLRLLKGRLNDMDYTTIVRSMARRYGPVIRN